MVDTILVTGGYGFIGTNFIRYILPISGFNIINLDLETYAANPANLEDLKLNKKFFNVKGDIADKNLVMQILDETKPKYIVNFAAESHVDNSLKESNPFWHSNVEGANNLLECARDYGKLEKFLQVSTDEVYGSTPSGAFSESSPFKPTSPYAKSKAAAERIARDYFRNGEVPVVITRSSNNFGPYQHPEKFIPRSITNVLVGTGVPLMNKGINVRDWIHVQDNVEALYQVLLRGKIGEAYNISGGNELQNIEIVNMILGKLRENDSDEDKRKWIREIEDRKNHDLRYAITGAKIRKELGWEPKCSGRLNVNGVIQYTCDWYLKNYQWWADSKKNAEERYGMGKLMTPLIESFVKIRSDEDAKVKAEEARLKAAEETERKKAEESSWANKI